MGFFDRIFGRKQEPQTPPPTFGSGPVRLSSQAAMSPDEMAVQRYRYMLQSAPPETIEQAHAEAFEKLTPEQRALALRSLSAELPPHERETIAPHHDDPRSLARLATRAEIRQPGTLERAFGGANAAHYGHQQGGMMGGMGIGGMIAGTILASLAASFVGTMIAQQFFEEFGDPLADMGMEDPMAAVEDPMAAAEESFGDFGDFGGFEEF
jgi:hypothetical protein